MRYKLPISVILTCNNGSKFISESIKSILTQTFKAFELIIIDDGSKDTIESEILSFDDHRIVYTKNARSRGYCASINMGFSVAKGKYICLMDADGIAASNRLNRQYAFLESHLHVGCLGGAISINNEVASTSEIIKNPGSHAYIRTRLLKSCSINPSTVMIRSNLLRKHELFYDENMSSDAEYDFFIRSSNFFSMRNLDQSIVEYKSVTDQELSNLKIEKNESITKNDLRKELLKGFDFNPSKEEVELHLKLMDEKYMNDDDLLSSENWCNKLIESNYRTKTFNGKALYELLVYSLIIAQKNNSLGGASIEKALLSQISNVLSNGASILEFGSGEGTQAMLEKYKVTSVEHDESFCFNRGEDHDIIHAPILKKWYNTNEVSKVLQKEYDLILVDGPPQELRAGILQNLSLFKGVETPFIFDDIDREFDKDVMQKFCTELNYNYKIIDGQRKKFAFCTKN